jgi:hypothetical protein
VLELRQVPEEAANGQGYVFCAAAGLKSGAIVKQNGVWSAAGGPSGYEGKPGYAPSGAKQWAPMLHSDGVNTNPQTWIIKKYQFRRDNADLTNDAIVSGDMVVAYNQGYFETDQYSTGTYDGITSAMAVGTYLCVSGNLLCSGVRSVNPYQPFRAQFWGFKSSTYDTYRWARAPITVQILPVAIATSGWMLLT